MKWMHPNVELTIKKEKRGRMTKNAKAMSYRKVPHTEVSNAELIYFFKLQSEMKTYSLSDEAASNDHY